MPVGLATGLAAWLLSGGLSVHADTLSPAHERLRDLRPPPATADGRYNSGAIALLSSPLFALTTGPGAVREPAIRVDGISVTRRRLAALVAIDERPAEWLTVGESREGVTLQAVSQAGATFETAVGVKALGLGEQSAASAPAANPARSGDAETLVQDRPPPGVRLPPEPASAPQPR